MRTYQEIVDHHGRFSPQALNFTRQQQARGKLPVHAYMYVGTKSIQRSLEFDRGTVPGCEYLENYWQLRLLIAQMAKTEGELMRAVGLYTAP